MKGKVELGWTLILYDFCNLLQEIFFEPPFVEEKKFSGCFFSFLEIKESVFIEARN